MKKINLENGNYVIVYYYNDNNASVDELKATKCIICEFDKNDKLIKESSFIKGKNSVNDDISLEDNSNCPVCKK